MKRLLHFGSAILIGVSAINAEPPGSGNLPVQPSAQSAAIISESEDAMMTELSELVSLVLAEQPAADDKVRYETLTDEDFKIVADDLGVEVAAIKAVVRIEAGPQLQGFWAPGVPVANYAQSLFNKYKSKTKGRKIKDAKVPSGLSGFALKEWTSLTNARKINADAADMGTYWGMFQIGGFNYKLCGCNSVEEMVVKVCESELSQLQMFAVFIRNSGMLESLQKKDWAAFARKYNGPSYAKRGYHTRMAKEYAKYKNASTSKPSKEKRSEVKPNSSDKTPEVAAKSTEGTKKKAPVRKKTRSKRKTTSK